jgi:putative ABC transport system ATP-binding protein
MHADPGSPRVSDWGVPLALSGVEHAFGRGLNQMVALRGIDVSFAAGTWTAVMGPSGSGKSTLLHCAAGLLRPTAGQIMLNGVDLRKASDRQITRLHRDQVGFVFQSFNLVPALTAAQNVALPSRWAGKRLTDAQIRAALTRVGLENRANHRPDQLSGGQQQRVAIARALVTQRAVIFADEPTGALDRASGAEVMGVFRSATEHGSAVVMVTHDPAVAARADRVLFLMDGSLGAQLPGGDPELIATTLANAESTVAGSTR